MEESRSSHPRLTAFALDLSTRGDWEEGPQRLLQS